MVNLDLLGLRRSCIESQNDPAYRDYVLRIENMVNMVNYEVAASITWDLS